MTTAQTSRPGSGTAGRGPAPISLRRRWMLRRQGRRDGRARQPDPLLLPDPVTTGMRSLLMRELATGWARARQEYTEDTATPVATLQALLTEHRRWRFALADALRELAVSAPAGGPAERRPGEQHQAEQVVRARRAREAQRATAAVRGRRDQARSSLLEVRSRFTRIRAEVEQRYERAVATAYQLRAAFLRDQAIYDQALLRRHPEGDLLRDLLDTTEPELPPWTGQPPRLPELPDADELES